MPHILPLKREKGISVEGHHRCLQFILLTKSVKLEKALGTHNPPVWVFPIKSGEVQLLKTPPWAIGTSVFEGEVSPSNFIQLFVISRTTPTHKRVEVCAPPVVSTTRRVSVQQRFLEISTRVDRRPPDLGFYLRQIGADFRNHCILVFYVPIKPPLQADPVVIHVSVGFLRRRCELGEGLLTRFSHPTHRTHDFFEKCILEGNELLF